MGAQVVHARAGRRDQYAPRPSRLCRSADPLDVVGALLALHPFPVLYVADLDAIRGCGEHSTTLAAVRNRHPDLTLWVDSGLADGADCARWMARSLGSAVLGSESLTDLDVLRSPPPGFDPVLSLDFTESGFVGPPELLAQPGLWPRRVIAMSLARVGMARGPDLARLAQLRARAPRVALYAAGGVRGREDLETLQRLGVQGVLLASALHDGSVSGIDLAAFGAT